MDTIHGENEMIRGHIGQVVLQWSMKSRWYLLRKIEHSSHVFARKENLSQVSLAHSLNHLNNTLEVHSPSQSSTRSS